MGAAHGATYGQWYATEAQVRELRRKQHQAVRKVHQDLEGFAFNTMISALMEYNNYLWRAKETTVVTHAAWGEAVRTWPVNGPCFPTYRRRIVGRSWSL